MLFRSKLILEKYIQLSKERNNTNYLILRPSNIYGVGNNWRRNQGAIHKFIYNALSNLPIEIWGDGKAIRDYLYIDDFCRAVNMLIEKNITNEILNIGSSIGFSINQIKDLIIKYSNNNLKIIYKEARQIDVPFNILDIKKIKSKIGWEPKVSISEGIERTIKWMKNEVEKEL